MSARRYTPEQVALIALLPKTGNWVGVTELAHAAGCTEWRVCEALRGPWMDDGLLAYSVALDAYRLVRETQSVLAQTSTPRAPAHH